MANTEALVLQMSADIRKMEKALNQVRGQTNRQLGAVEQRFDKMNEHVRRSGDDMARDLRNSFAAIGIAVAIREVTSYADAWTTARNKLAAAGVEQGKLAATLEDLASLAQSTRSGFEETVTLYTRLTNAGKKLNLTNQEVRRITETTLQAFVAGGAAASEQAASITQLSQALGSGVLQGDELKSIRENAPLLAQAIADEFKTTIAGLKDLGAEGKLTADRVAKAILNADGISEQFGRTIATVAQSVTNLQTAFTKYIGESRVAQTVTQALSGFIQFVTNNIGLLTDAAIVAAQVIGGTLAAGAMIRFGTALVKIVGDVRKAATAMEGLKLAMTFLGGPVGAIILGIGAALATVALNSAKASVSVEDVRRSLDRYQELQGKIVSDTAELKKAQDALNEAIRTQGKVAQDAARAHEQGILRQIAANKTLLGQEELKMKTQLQTLQQQDTPARGGLGNNLRRTLFGDNTIGEQRELLGLKIEGLGAVGPRQADESLEQWYGRTRDYLNGLHRKFSTLETDISNRLTEIDGFDQNIRDLKQQIADTAAILDPEAQLELDRDLAQFNVLRGGGADGGSGGGSGAGRGFQTGLEKLSSALKDIRANAAADEQALSAAAQAMDHLNQLRSRFATFGAEFSTETGLPDDPNSLALNRNELTAIQAQSAEDDAAAFKAVTDRIAEAAAERSRIAVAAILDLANGEGGLAQAFAQIDTPDVQALLLGGDEALLRAELTKNVQAQVDALATGYAKLDAERTADLAALEATHRNAMAAGIDDWTGYYAKLSEIEQAWADGRRELDDKRLGPIGDIPGVADLAARDTGIADMFHKEWDPIFDKEKLAEDLRQTMRESVKDAMREGIRTGDWGDSFAAILADAVTTGLDSALNRVGDWLADFLFSDNGFLSSIVSSASAFMGGRPTGGSVGAGGAYRVNDRGDKGEFLFMGSNPGQVLRGSDIAGLMGAGRGGPSVINMNLNVAGSIDAATMPQVRAMMRQATQQIMSAVPTVVRGTITHDRVHKRKL